MTRDKRRESSSGGGSGGGRNSTLRDTNVISVTALDGHVIGDGKPGPVFRLVADTILEEASNGTHKGEKIM